MTAGPARTRGPLLAGGLVVTAGLLVAFVLWANKPPLPLASSPALDAALAAVREDPLRVEALRDLALDLDRRGDREAAVPLMSLVGERSKRDTAASLWLMQRALEAGDYDGAFGEADALLRRDIEPERRERLYALLTAAAAVDPARPALVRRLAERPWWRESFLRDLAAKGDPDAGQAVLIGLQALNAGPAPDESQAFLVRRVALGQFAAAVQEGERVFGPATQDLNDQSIPPPIGWSAAQGEGASSSVEDGRLTLTYDGFASAALPRRLLALLPGAWTITFKHRTLDGSIPRLKVALRCAEGTSLAQAPPLGASTAWRSEKLAANVPPTGCAGQWLSIIPDPGERREAVETEFGNWAFARMARPPLPR